MARTPSPPRPGSRIRSVRAPASLMFHTSSIVVLALALLIGSGPWPPAPGPHLRASRFGGQAYEFTQIHMGLPVRLVLHALDRSAAESAARDAFARIAELDRIMSDYRPNSELRAIHPLPNPLRGSAELMAVLGRAVEIAEATDGAFDLTVGPLVALWRHARIPRRLPEPSAVQSARQRSGWRQLEFHPESSSIRIRVENRRLDLG